MQIGRRIGRYLSDRRSDWSGARAARSIADLGQDGSQIEAAGDSRIGTDQVVKEIGGSPQDVEWVEEMEDERLQILRMVEEHKVTADEAAKLLAALEAPTKPAEAPGGTRPRWLRIRVTDTVSGRAKVNVNVPVGVISAAGKLGVRFGLGKIAEREGLDLDELLQVIQSGAEGKLVDVSNEEGGEHVEIFVE